MNLFYSFNTNVNYIVLCTSDTCNNYTWFNSAIHYSVITIKYYPQFWCHISQKKAFLLVSCPKTCFSYWALPNDILFHNRKKKKKKAPWWEPKMKPNIKKIWEKDLILALAIVKYLNFKMISCTDIWHFFVQYIFHWWEKNVNHKRNIIDYPLSCFYDLIYWFYDLNVFSLLH